MKNIKYDVVIYHRNCADGFAGFYLFYKTKMFKKLHIYPDVPSTTYIPPNIANKNIIIIDVAYHKEVAEQIVNSANYVLFIDHHISVIDDWNKLKEKYNNKLDIHYNINKSGVGLTYEYFKQILIPRLHINIGNKNNGDSENEDNGEDNDYVPRFVKYVEKNDIGKWEDMNVVYFTTALEIDYTLEPTKTNIKKWDKLLHDKTINELIRNGKMYYKYKNFIVDKIARNYVKYGNVIYVNVPGFIGGEIANYLVKENPTVDYVVAWQYNYHRDIYIVQLRSKSYDVSQIAKKYSGGGHTLAASFSTKIHPHTLFNIPFYNPQ